VKQAVGYVRVSTADQAADGVSLEAQRAKIESWTKLNGYELHAVHVDAGLSGGRSDNRPALQRAMEEACSLKAALVVYSLSRLARSTRDTLTISERLDRAGADLVSLSEKIDSTSASGKMVFRLLAVLAEFEKDLISERTKAAMSHLKHKNQRVGSIPFGFRLMPGSKTLVEDSAEQRTAKTVVALREQGYTFAAIVQEMTTRGLPCRNAKRWHPQLVSNILKRHGANNARTTVKIEAV
jgi:site-specific DNA recombinase